MDQAEFDAFADEYHLAHGRNIKASGESPEFFHEYKVVDVATALAPASAESNLQILDFGCQLGEALRERISRRRSDHAVAHRSDLWAFPKYRAVPAAGHTGVNTQDRAARIEHEFVL